MNQNYLAHFTKNGVMSVLEEDNPINIYTEYTAIRRLISAHSAQTVTCVAVQTVTSETMFFCAKLC